MKKIIIIALCLSGFQALSQQLSKQIVNVYLGTYIDGEVEIEELLESPRINISNANDKLISSTLYDSIGGTAKQQFINNYDNSGSLISSTYGNGQDIVWSETKYFYNDKGLLVSEESYDFKSKKLESKKVFQYDKYDNLIREERRIDGKSYAVELYEIKYKKGVIQSIEIKKATNENLVSHILETYKNGSKLTSEDILKGWITTFEYYPNGKEKLSKRVINGKESTQYSFYDYDDKGRVTIQAWVESSGFGEITIKSYTTEQ